MSPVFPILPTSYVAALWFGTNADSLILLSTPGQPDSVAGAKCVEGVLTGTHPDRFGQVSFCNAPNFFQSAFALVASGHLVVPPLGTAKDGQPCPTVRDFGVVDQDQSDNVVTTYLLTTDGTVAQNTTANRAAVSVLFLPVVLPSLSL